MRAFAMSIGLVLACGGNPTADDDGSTSQATTGAMPATSGSTTEATTGTPTSNTTTTGTSASTEGNESSDGGESSSDDGGVVPPPMCPDDSLFVSTRGSDDDPGTADAPMRTIQAASDLATPGTTVCVLPGIYDEAVESWSEGEPDAPIHYLSQEKWGAKIRPSTVQPGVIWNNYGSHVVIENFELDGTDAPDVRCGICFTGNDTWVVGNHVFNVLLNGAMDSNGGAGIDMVGNYYLHTGQHVHGNYVHDIGGGKNSDHRVHGIYYAGTDGTIVNNIVHSTPDGIVTNHDPSHLLIANNTIFGNRSGISIYGGDDSAIPEEVLTDYITVINNIVFDNGGYGITEGGTTGPNNVYRNNLVFGHDVDWRLQNDLQHEGSVSADPLFVDYQPAGGGDYRLQAESPAIDVGTDEQAPEVDIEGVVRPYGDGIDLGAHEWRP